MTRIRLVYAACVSAAVLLGLGSRKFGELLPSFIADHAGDALWAAMIYFGWRTLFPLGSKGAAALISLAFSCGIELSQTIQVEWLDRIRQTTLGALVLGRGFLLIDLLRYAAGIAAACLLDQGLNRKAGSK